MQKYDYTVCITFHVKACDSQWYVSLNPWISTWWWRPLLCLWQSILCVLSLSDWQSESWSAGGALRKLKGVTFAVPLAPFQSLQKPIKICDLGECICHWLKFRLCFSHWLKWSNEDNSANTDPQPQSHRYTSIQVYTEFAVATAPPFTYQCRPDHLSILKSLYLQRYMWSSKINIAKWLKKVCFVSWFGATKATFSEGSLIKQ